MLLCRQILPCFYTEYEWVASAFKQPLGRANNSYYILSHHRNAALFACITTFKDLNGAIFYMQGNLSHTKFSWLQDRSVFA